MKRDAILRILGVTIAILLIPLVSMLFTDEMQWGPEDFAIVAALVIAAGVIYELATAKMTDKTKKLGVLALVTVAALIIWAQLAVGII